MKHNNKSVALVCTRRTMYTRMLHFYRNNQ